MSITSLAVYGIALGEDFRRNHSGSRRSLLRSGSAIGAAPLVTQTVMAATLRKCGSS
jgi:hypothetical protein